MPQKSGKLAKAKQSATKPTAKAKKASPAAAKSSKLSSLPSYPIDKKAEAANKPKTFPKLPSVWKLSKATAKTLWANKLLFLSIVAVYAVLNIVLVHGLSGASNLADVKYQLSQIFVGHYSVLAASIGGFMSLLGSAGGSPTSNTGIYQLLITAVVSLALIWSLRQVMAGIEITARDAFYRGMYPLVPFTIVLIICGLQLLPLVIGSSLYSLVITNGIAVTAAEHVLWGVLYAALLACSLYMVTASLFAIYIVTLPDMTPLKAIRSAKELVRGRRWEVLRKLISLPIVLVIIAAVIMVPIITIATTVAQWVFFVLTVIGIAVVHGYMYTLYRELLNE